MKIKIKSWEELSVIGQSDGWGAIEQGDTRFVVEMKKFCGQIIEVELYEPWNTGDYDRQTLDGVWLFASWMYKEVNLMNRNGANT